MRRSCISSCLLPICHVYMRPSPAELRAFPLHDALPICGAGAGPQQDRRAQLGLGQGLAVDAVAGRVPVLHPRHRSEEHTSELQSLTNLECRLLREKNNKLSKSKLQAAAAPTTGANTFAK